MNIAMAFFDKRFGISADFRGLGLAGVVALVRHWPPQDRHHAFMSSVYALHMAAFGAPHIAPPPFGFCACEPSCSSIQFLYPCAAGQILLLHFGHVLSTWCGRYLNFRLFIGIAEC